MNQLPVPGRDTVYVWTGRAVGDQRELTRRLLRRAGGALLGRPEAEIGVRRAPGGRPEVYTAGGRTLPVSVSHVDGMVVVAARAGGPVGVDVERCRPLPAAPLARRWYHPAEAAWLAARAEAGRELDFLRLWTAKEAVGKALGTGLRDGGLRRRMPVPDGGEVLRPVPDCPGVRVGHPAGAAGLVLAVAVAGAAGPVEVTLA
ncbi:4'-phosphopantetheinyl transferase superfamily protein [Micromonospora sp. HK10]|uniref:4'-phosphopantetheinyl transferase family protein n=1 Tax=Micromonospora sp. HK10 TaxID=1538294 RepID=UPI00062711E2|nr:4'-phosphopantetheinyl transferase superfamily protein [Micromonospora sp. HK10]KKK01339.1 4-phosphopantetheinyl transferase [Micromonospora sp. HK10]